MVAVVTGTGLGLERSSAWVLGSRGQLGDAAFNRFGENVYVNAATGNLIVNRVDEILLGKGPDNIVTRSYNSLAAGTDDNGDNWRLNSHRCLISQPTTIGVVDSTITLVDWDGSETVFTCETLNGPYINRSGQGAYDTLAYTGGGTPVWTWTDGNSRVQDVYTASTGRIQSTKDVDGNQLTYTYTGSLLTRVETESTFGQNNTHERTDFVYSGSNLTEIQTTTSTGSITRVKYEYEEYQLSGVTRYRLSKVTTDLTLDNTADSVKVETAYTYVGTTTRIASITQTGNAKIDIEYDTNSRVSALVQTVSNGVTRRTEFTYDAANRIGTIHDALGRDTTVAYDTKNQLTEITLPAAAPASAQVLKFTYDSYGNVTGARDGSQNWTKYVYADPATCNMTRQYDDLGNTIDYTYGANNEVLTATRYVNPGPGGTGASGSLTTHYVYDDENHLRFVITAEGDVTEYTYSGPGLRTASIRYADQVYDRTSYVLAEISDWVGDIADKSTIERVNYAYDFRGNLKETRTFSLCAADGTGLTTEANTKVSYVYDQFGSLLSRLTSGISNEEIFVYDGLGRLTSAIDVRTTETTITYDDGARTMTVKLGAGLPNEFQTVSSYNRAGELVTLEQSGTDFQTATSNYKYDSLGRLRMATDGSARSSYHLYDEVGRKVADIAADRSIVEYGYDKSDRLVKTIKYSTLVDTAAFALLDDPGSDGNIADALLANMRPEQTQAQADLNQWEWRVYDKADRLVEVIDGNGGCTVFAYDGVSRLVKTTSFHNTKGASAIAGYKTTTPTTIQLPSSSTEDNIIRTFYDDDGAVIGTLDGKGYLTKTVYNYAGEKIETIAFATQITNTTLLSDGEFDDLVAAAGTNSHDEHNHYVYDGRGLLRFTINANLRPTEYIYDDAGHLINRIDYKNSIASASSHIVEDIAGQISASSDDRKSWFVYATTSGDLRYSIDAGGAVSSFEYDNFGRVSKECRFATLRTTTSLPTVGNMNNWASSNAAGVRIGRKIYNPAGWLAYSVNAENYVTEYRYDQAGRLVRQIAYADTYTITDGDDTIDDMQAKLPASVPTSARQTYFSYDPVGRLYDTEDAEGFHTVLSYDALDRVTERKLASGSSDEAKITYGYDAAGRLTSETRWNGASAVSTTTYSFDGMGRLIDRTVGLNGSDTNEASTTHFEYNSIGQIVTETQGYGTSAASSCNYTYDAFGNIASKTDGRGNTTTFEYDKLDHVTKVTVPIDASTTAVTEHQYDAFGNLSVTIYPFLKTDATNHPTVYFFYDKVDRLTLQVDQERYATITTYTAFGDVASVKRCFTQVTGTITPGTPPTVTLNANRDGLTSFAYDRLGRLTGTTDAESFTETYGWDGFDRTQVVNKLTGTTNTAYDKRGRLTSETFVGMLSVRADGTTQATGITNKFEYDGRGNRTKMTEAFGLSEQRITTYAYDDLDRLVTTTHELVAVINADLSSGGNVQPSETIVYDRRNNVVQTADAMGAKTFFYYDALDRKIFEINAAGTLSKWEYDANGNITKVWVNGAAVTVPSSPAATCPSSIDTNNCRLTTYEYDYANRQTKTIVASLLTGEYGTPYATTTGSITITNEYDRLGNVIRQEDGRANSVYFYYDKLNRKIAQVDQEKYITTYDLDHDGNVLAETRFATRYTSAVSTGTQPSVSADGTNDRVTEFKYDRNGHRTEEKRLNVKFYNVNVAGGALGDELTGSAVVIYTYNGLGEVTSKTEATGDSTTYTYDNFGRQTAIADPSFTDYRGTSVQHSVNQYYDGLNNLTRTFEADQDTSVAVDRVTTFTYDKMGRLATMTDASGFVRTYAYDKNGRTILESYQRLKSNGTTVDEGNVSNYDSLGRVIMQSVATKSGSTWSIAGDKSQTRYNVYGEVDARGVNITNLASGPWQERFWYDNGGRMWKSTAGDGTTRLYVYDKNGAQTLAIASSGAAPSGYNWSTVTIEDAVSLLTSGGSTFAAPTVTGMVLTVTVYDKRGQSTSTREPARQLSSSTTATIVRSRAYNAFGEVKQETDARGYVSDYSYSTIGKVIKRESPTVSWTSESGANANARPTEEYFYDRSGRVVGTKNANGKVNTRTLLAGTGYGDDADPSVLKEFHADGGVYERKFDVYGDLRSEINEVGKTESFAYDKAGRLTSQVHETRPANSPGNPGSASTLTDTYTYDGLGHRITHYNSQLGSSYKDLIAYDVQGRVLSMTTMGGDVTSYTYTWDGDLETDLNGTASDWEFGGWIKTTTNAAGKTMTEKLDYFGRLVDKTDFGNHNFDYTFDRAGRTMTSIVNSTTTTWGYYNTGLSASVVTGSATSSYKYDESGNRIFEGYQSGSTWLEYANVAYDAMNRMTSLDETGAAASTGTPTITWKYDLAGNIRNMHAVYNQIDDNGNVVTGTDVTQDYWYKYDSMNRFVLTKGKLLSGAITIEGTVDGRVVTYNGAGQRATVTKPMVDDTWTDQETHHVFTYHVVESEIYTYSADGYLAKVETAYDYSGATDWQTDRTDLTATYTRDAMGRVSDYKEYTFSSQSNPVFRRQTTFNAKSQVTQDITTTVRSDGTYVATTDYHYSLYDGSGSLTDATNYDGASLYQGGVVTYQHTYTDLPGSDHTNSGMKNTFVWWDGAQTLHSDYGSQINEVGFEWESDYTYDTRGRLTKVSIDDGHTSGSSTRDIDFVNDADGRVLTRHEDGGSVSGDPFEIHYYLNGMRVGDVGNNGTSNVDYAASIAEHTRTQGSGPFMGGRTTAQNVLLADFDQSYDPINGLTYASTASRYTVAEGDTLQSIAYAIWGDASFWYMLADANGLDGSETLTAGSELIIPNKVHNAHNSSDVYRVYDPNEAIGNTSPTQPKPQKKADSGKCGGMGAILLAVIAAAVAAIVFPAVLGALGTTLSAASFGEAFVAGAVSGVAGSVASQTVGVITGIQSKFDWGGVAMAAIGGGIGAGLGTVGWLQGNLGADMLRGALGNAITQGIGVATGLQKRFDWAGVAAAGVMSGVSGLVSRNIPGAATSTSPATLGNQFVSGMAGMLAGAATRSLINGSNFGDNILAMLPDVIGQTLGNAIAEAVEGSESDAMKEHKPAKDGEKIAYAANESNGLAPDDALTFDWDSAAQSEGGWFNQKPASLDETSIVLASNFGPELGPDGKPSPNWMRDMQDRATAERIRPLIEKLENEERVKWLESKIGHEINTGGLSIEGNIDLPGGVGSFSVSLGVFGDEHGNHAVMVTVAGGSVISNDTVKMLNDLWRSGAAEAANGAKSGWPLLSRFMKVLKGVSWSAQVAITVSNADTINDLTGASRTESVDVGFVGGGGYTTSTQTTSDGRVVMETTISAGFTFGASYSDKYARTWILWRY